VHVLAFLGLPAFDGGAAVSGSATTDAAESMGSSQCQTEVGDFRHGYDCAHGLREAGGSTEELQSEEQGQEKFSTPSDVYCGNQRVRRRRTAQRGSSHGEADRQAFGIGDEHRAERRESDYGRADCGFYCWEAVETYEKYDCQFIVVAQKTARLLEELKAAHWKRSPRTDADEQCEFWYQPTGWERAYRFIALRYKKGREAQEQESEQYQLFETSEYNYRVFVTNMDAPIDGLVWFYRQRASAENLIKEANNDAGWPRIPRSAGP
jgi:hypothetical protein